MMKMMLSDELPVADHRSSMIFYASKAKFGSILFQGKARLNVIGCLS